MDEREKNMQMTETVDDIKQSDMASDDHTIENVIKDFATQEANGDVVNNGVEELLIEKYMLLREKSQAFLKIYPKLIKAGFISIFVIPLIFMILMFTVNSKLVFLTLWIISIISICGYLIGVEYFYFYYLKIHEEFERARHPERYAQTSEPDERMEPVEVKSEKTKDELLAEQEVEDDKFKEGFLREDRLDEFEEDEEERKDTEAEIQGETDEEDI